MENPDMLAFTYRIQKIIRDMKHLPIKDAQQDIHRDAVIAALQAVCEQIDRSFS